MINIPHLLKVTAAWTSIVFTVCFLGVAMMPGIRPGFMRYAWHMNVNTGFDVLSFGTFVSGLVIWNVVAFLAVLLFASLFNTIKK